MHFINAMFYVAMAFSSLLQVPSGFEWNKKSTLSADHQVEFPGIVLEPGVYIVRLRESSEKRSSVQILNQDETQLLATVLAVPDHRVRPEDDNEFTFHAMKTAGPAPVQSWFFTGDLVGLEFVYPKPRAKEIAKESDGHVMASNSSKDAVILAITPNGKEIVIDDPLTQTARRKPQ
jgi:hypothetical protein